LTRSGQDQAQHDAESQLWGPLGHAAYCWGIGPFGIGLGDGTTITSITPVKVAGDFEFRAVGVLHTAACAVTVADQAYCWGTNGAGELGDGTTTNRPTPVAVVGP
jgi:hypothetical protein